MDLESFLKKDVFDMACSTGIYARNFNVKDTQINNIVELFESEPDPEVSIKMTIAFIAKQMGRKLIRREVANKLISDLRKIYGWFSGPELKRAAKVYLNLMKWFFDSGIRGNFRSFDEFISRMR